MDYIIGEAASQETAKEKCTKKVEIKPSPDYRKAQAYMRQAVAVKANIDHLLGVTDGRENKAQER